MSEQKTIRQYAKDYSIGLNEREAFLSNTAFIDGAAKQKELDSEEISILKDNAQRDFKDIQDLKTIIKEMSDHSKGYGHCGMDMFAHTKWRKFADELK